MADDKPTSPAAGTLTVSTESAAARRLQPTVRGSGACGPVSTPPPPTTPRDSTRYEILGEHGRGGLGLVHRAHDRTLGRDVAIKELIDRTSHLGEVRFLREAMITARLEHPGIVPVHEAGRWADGTPYYAMKLVAGRSLRDLIAERKTVDARLALLHHVIAVADAIAYAHGKQIVHRDLKPANVIVGDFGETIVIDWGLAKDLALGEAVEPSGSGERRARAGELTMTGSVVGTPAYMAPEQERGERVDQRADVYSIGAMLWELCALEHKPPGDARLRERTLRRAGIERDLIAIVQKALAGDPAHRYADAGALARDLKAFEAGARIAARHDSAAIRLMRWVRRHRAITATAGAALAVLAIGGVIFVRGLAVERDRADAASSRATRTADDLTLEHAELLLHTDPTAAAAALAGYHGGDALRRRRLIAEAEGRGTAVATTAPNNDTIWLLAPAPDGGVVSLSEDHTIRLSHGAEVTTLSGDVSSVVRVAYNPARGLIAFATGKPGVAVLDIAARKVTRITDANPDTIAFSPDGARLVVLDDHQVLHAWPTRGAPRELAPRELAARRFAVPAADRVVAQVDDGVVVLAEGAAAPVARLAASDVTALDGVADDVVLGSDDGTIRALDAGLHERGRGRVCHDRVRSVQLVPHGDLIAFACQDRTAGVARFDAAKHAVVVVDAFDSRGLAQTYLEPTGRYIGVTDESNTAYLYDLATHLLHHYDDGDAAQPAFVLPPSAALPFVVIGDNNGAVRTWRAPSTAGRVALHAPDGIYTLSFTPDSATLVAGGVDGAVHAIDLATTTEHALAGHAGPLRVVRTAADDASALSVGFDNTARLWRIGDGAVIRTFRGHAGEIADAAFLSTDPLRVVSAGGDGRLLAWAGDDAPATELYRQAAAFDRIAVLGASGQIAGVDIESHVRVFDAAGQAPPRALALPAGAEVTLLRASPDARWLAIGTAAGDVVVFDTATWRERQRHRAPGAIRQIAFDPQGRELAVASETGRAPAGHVEIVPLAAPTGRARSPWTEVTAMVRDVAYTPDGETLGFVTSDGGTWLYAIARDAWAYTRDHDTDTLVARFSPDGRQLATADRRGIVVVRDVAASFAPPPSTATAVSTTPSTTWSHR